MCYHHCCPHCCHCCCRPSWFEKYRNDYSSRAAQTVVYLAADRSAMAIGSFQEQQQRGFASAFYAMTGCASYAGYGRYLSRNFGSAADTPGVAMAKHLLAGGTVSSYPGTGAADNITQARFKPYTYRAKSTLQDQCQYMCSSNPCPVPPACAVNAALCNALTGTCDTACCDKPDGTECLLRGRASICEGGSCRGEDSQSRHGALRVLQITSLTHCVCLHARFAVAAVQHVAAAVCCAHQKTRQQSSPPALALRCMLSSCRLSSDRCKAPLCSAAPCQQLLDESGKPVNAAAAVLCHPGTGECRTVNLDNGKDCTYQGGPGACYSGGCRSKCAQAEAGPQWCIQVDVFQACRREHHMRTGTFV